MIMFLVMNTSGLILIPVSIMMYRSQMGAAQPTDIFIPTLITTAISTIVGVTAVSIAQRINLLNKPILILIGCISLFFSGLIYLFTQVSREEMGVYSTLVANIILFTIILLFILWGLWKRLMCTMLSSKAPRKDLQPPYASFPIWWHSSLESPFPHFGSDGYHRKRHRLHRRTIRSGHRVCRCAAHCIDEIVKRQRGQRTDD